MTSCSDRPASLWRSSGGATTTYICIRPYTMTMCTCRWSSAAVCQIQSLYCCKLLLCQRSMSQTGHRSKSDLQTCVIAS